MRWQALGVDLGSRTIGVWVAQHGTVTGPCGDTSARDRALRPGPATAVATVLRVRVRRAAAPRTAALRGAGRAAMSLLHRPRRALTDHHLEAVLLEAS